MELQELMQLLRQFIAAIQQVMASREVLSDELQGQIAQTLGLLYNRIERLQAGAQGLPPSPPSQDHQLQPGMPSSNVNSFGYNPETQELRVKFNGKDQKDAGPTYSYQGVPRNIVELFQRGVVPARTLGHNKWGEWFPGKVPSLGASAYTLITSQAYPYQRLS